MEASGFQQLELRLCHFDVIDGGGLGESGVVNCAASTAHRGVDYHEHRGGRNAFGEFARRYAINFPFQRSSRPDELIHMEIFTYIRRLRRARLKAAIPRYYVLPHSRFIGAFDLGDIDLIGARLWPVASPRVVRGADIRCLTVSA
jgi:hypothetical protein